MNEIIKTIKHAIGSTRVEFADGPIEKETGLPGSYIVSFLDHRYKNVIVGSIVNLDGEFYKIAIGGACDNPTNTIEMAALKDEIKKANSQLKPLAEKFGFSLMCDD